MNIFWSSFKCISVEKMGVISLWVLQSLEKILCSGFWSELAYELRGQRLEEPVSELTFFWESTKPPCLPVWKVTSVMQSGRDGTCRPRWDSPRAVQRASLNLGFKLGAPVHIEAVGMLLLCEGGLVMPPHWVAWRLTKVSWKTEWCLIDSENSVDLSCRKLFLSVLEIAVSRSPPVTLQSTKLCLWTWRCLGDCIPVVLWTQKNLSSVASGCVHSCWK